MPVIDVHTHMFTDRFMALLKAKGGMCNLQARPDGQVEIFRHDTPVAIPQRGHFDYELRLRDMDADSSFDTKVESHVQHSTVHSLWRIGLPL